MTLLIAALAGVGVLESDGEETRRNKSVLALIATVVSTFAVFWGTIYLGLGRPLTAAIPLGYALISFATLAHFAHRRRFPFFRFS